MPPWNKKTTEQFIEEAKRVHNGFYSYDKSCYIDAKTNVIITCPVHGDFTQNPNDHRNGHGCKACKSAKQSSRQQDTEATFKEKAQRVHGDKYIYLDVVYINSKTKVTIHCPIHGNFQQAPSDHLQGKGCAACGRSGQPNIYSFSEWKAAGEVSKLFQGYSLYIIEGWDSKERFLKVGKTYTGISTRLRNAVFPYEYKVLVHHVGSANYISHLEADILKALHCYKYTPLLDFGGKHECFSPQHRDKIIETFEVLSNGSYQIDCC